MSDSVIIAIITAVVGPVITALITAIATKVKVSKGVKADFESFKQEVKNDIKAEVKAEISDVKKDLQKVKDANASSLYFQIDRACTDALNEGEIDKEAYKALKAAWTAYHGAGGNGYLNAMMDKVDKLPFKKDYGI